MNAIRQSGFSLIELMTVVAIVGILASLAVPSTRQAITRMQVKSAASDLVASITAARLLALETTTTTELRPVSAPANGNWNTVQNDAADQTATNITGVSAADKALIEKGNASWYVAVLPPGAPVLVRNITPISDKIKIKADPVSAVGNITFDFSGRRNDGMGTEGHIRYTVCSPSIGYAQYVNVQRSGQVTTENPTGAVVC